jgi:hypothetical protein
VLWDFLSQNGGWKRRGELYRMYLRSSLREATKCFGHGRKEEEEEEGLSVA